MLNQTGPYFRDPISLHNDPRYVVLSYAEKGMFGDLCDRQWTGEGIPADPARLMIMLGITDRPVFDQIWEKLKEFFRPIAGRPGKLFFADIEADRQRRDRRVKDKAAASKKGALRRWELERQRKQQQKDTSGSIAEQPALALLDGCPIPITISKEEENKTPLPPKQPASPEALPAVAPERPKDEAFETFCAMHDAAKAPAKYNRNRKHDFVALAEFRKTHGLENLKAPPDWSATVQNYLASPRRLFTLADLLQYYVNFVRGKVDRFGIPAEEKPNGTVQQRNGIANTRTAGQNPRGIPGLPTYQPKQ